MSAVSTTSATAPIACAPLTDQVKEPSGTDHSTWSTENQGTKPPKYLPKPTASAALPPLMITQKAVQPKRKPHSGPYASLT